MRKMEKWNYLKLGILLFGISVLLWNCEQNELINLESNSQESNLKVRRLTFEELKKIKTLKSTLQNINKKFDVNKKKANQNKNSIISVDGSFTILTDDIIEVALDSSITYSFRIETPTDSISTFENLIIKQENDLLDFFIYKYRYNEIAPTEFPYEVMIQPINETQINAEDFSDYLKSFTLFWGGCWWYYESHGHGELLFCLLPVDNSDSILDSEGWSGSSTVNTSGTNGTNSNNNNGMGSTGLPLGNNLPPVGIVLSPQEIAYNEIRECLNPISMNLSTWLNSQNKPTNSLLGASNIFNINNYLQQNNCSTDSQNFIEEAIEALMNGDEVDFINSIIIDDTFKDTETDCIHKKLKEDNTNFYSKMLLNFNGTQQNKFLRFKIGPTINNTDWGMSKHESGTSSVYEITITSNLNNASNLAKMVTLSHELIHAYMFSSLEDWGFIVFDNNGAPELNVHCEPLFNYSGLNLNSLTIKQRFVAIICAYRENGLENAQWNHNLFDTWTFDVNTYREELKQLLVNEHDWVNESENFKNTAISIFGETNWIDEVATAVSWIGLDETVEFGNYTDQYSAEPFKLIFILDVKNQIQTAKSNCL